MSSANNWVCFLMGLGVGAAVGILWAPQSGAVTRGFLRNNADEGAKYAKQKAADAIALAKQKADEFKKTAGDTIDQSKQAIMMPLANLSSAIEAGKKAYQEASKAMADDSVTT